MIHWSFGASIPVLIFGVALWGCSGWLSYLNWRRSGRRRAMAVLESIRFVIITALLFTLMRPEIVRLITRTNNPQVTILVDGSGSMQTKDLLEGTNVITRETWLKKARESQFWKPLEKSARVVIEEFSSSGQTNPASVQAPTAPETATAHPATEGTDLNAALEKTLQRQQNLKAVLVLSDGDWNIGNSPVSAATRYREQNVPIFAVSVGREQPLPDLILESVSPPAYGIFGEQISIPFKIRSYLPREAKTKVALQDGSRETSEKEITIPAQSEFQDAILWSPRAVGENQLTLQLPLEKDESLAENNQQSFKIAIRVETLKVLVVDSLPRWEYRFLRNALARDPGVEMQSILYHPGMSVGGGRGYLKNFPGTKEALSRYDVIFLGDVGLGSGELTEPDLELIKGLVQQQGSGLVFLPGRRGRQATFMESPVKEMIPVLFDTAKPTGIGLQNESILLPSTMGRTHLLTRFESDGLRNEEIWKQLPGFFWSAAVEKSRPGSEVLAVHSALRNSSGRIPLLVTRPFGNGKVLFMGTDSAWRWRRGVEDRYHYRFWSQVVRWMAHQRHLSEKEGIRVTFTPETPELGDTVFLQTTVLDRAGFPLQEGTVDAKITTPNGKTERLMFTPMEGGWGVFKSSFTPQEGGIHKITVSNEAHKRELETKLNVAKPEIEKLGQPVNAPILREITSMTGGQAGEIEQMTKLLEQISTLPEPQPLERRLRLWSNPWWGGSILFLMAVYWVGRKIAGVI